MGVYHENRGRLNGNKSNDAPMFRAARGANENPRQLYTPGHAPSGPIVSEVRLTAGKGANVRTEQWLGGGHADKSYDVETTLKTDVKDATDNVTKAVIAVGKSAFDAATAVAAAITEPNVKAAAIGPDVIVTPNTGVAIVTHSVTVKASA